MTAATLEIAVIVIDSAVSPRATCVSRFAVVPPGDAPRSTSPTASAASRPTIFATANASSGEITSRLTSPIPTPFGNRRTRAKSAGVSDSPRLTMITASESGRRVAEKIEDSSPEALVAASAGAACSSVTATAPEATAPKRSIAHPPMPMGTHRRRRTGAGGRAGLGLARMATVLCVLYDDPVDGYPSAYPRDGIPAIESYYDGQ